MDKMTVAMSPTVIIPIPITFHCVASSADVVGASGTTGVGAVIVVVDIVQPLVAANAVIISVVAVESGCVVLVIGELFFVVPAVVLVCTTVLIPIAVEVKLGSGTVVKVISGGNSRSGVG